MKKPTSKDVAKRAGVSQTTVSFVLNNTPGVSLTDDTKKKVYEAAQALNYMPNSNSKSLKKTKFIGLLVPSLINPFYLRIIQDIENYASSLDLNVLLCCSYRDTKKEKANLDLMLAQQVQGIIYTYTPNHIDKVIKISKSIPVVLMSEKKEKIPLNTISMNGFMCGALVSKHLLELNHRKLAYVLSPLKSTSFSREQRLNGIYSSIREAGLSEDSIKVFTFEGSGYEDSNENFEIKCGYQITKRILSQTDITGIICVNDMVAFGAVSCLLNQGIEIPKDVSVCGFDNIYFSQLTKPQITTVDYNITYFCKLAVDMLFDNNFGYSNSVNLSSDPQLIIRGSTGPAPAK